MTRAVPQPFSVLQFPPPLARAIGVLGFAAMTPVQEHALPSLLAGRIKGRTFRVARLGEAG